VLLACLPRLKKRYKLSLGFTPEFIKNTLGPCLLDKKTRWYGDIKKAVNLWCSDPAAAEEQYGHISQWDVSHVTNMDELFRWKDGFNADISAWDVSNVTTMHSMFTDAWSLNQPMGAWDVSKVEGMQHLFCGARAFNQPIGKWDALKVTTMHRMFYYATSFNQAIGGWDVSKVTDMEGTFYGCPIAPEHKPTGSNM
jgi:surface protein